MPKAAATQPGLVDRIAHDIQSGVYGAGAWLKQIDLQERYDCTRLEVRRALDQLTAKRLIAHIPNRGYHVYAMDPDVHGQIRDIRILLETGAAADLMPNVTSAKVRALRALAERFAKLLQDGTLLEQYEVNLAFHAALYDLCSNRELVALIQETRARAGGAGRNGDARAHRDLRARAFRHGRRARGARRQAPAEDHRGARGPGHFLSAAANRGLIP